MKKALTHTQLVLVAAFLIAVFHNFTFFSKVSAHYDGQIFFKISVFIIFLSILNILLSVFAHRRATKPVLITFILFSALHAYFTDNFGVVSDSNMIRNILKTDFAEARDLFSFTLLAYVVFLGFLPAAMIYFLPLKEATVKSEALRGLRSVAVSILVIIISLFSFGKSYASFFREHKSTRYYTNPVFFVYSSLSLVNQLLDKGDTEVAGLGRDAHIPEADNERELIIFVLGETARSDRFSLNGYKKETNPLLKKENVISFTDVHSCGTSTATSVPCLFSIFGRSAFDHESADGTENLVDVLEHTGRVNVLWRDNNSDSKGVAVRVPFEDFRSKKANTICDVECRDEGMLVGLQKYIDQQSKGDVFIVLHQMGNHGPAYYKRYPERFEKFKPVCKSSDLGKCTSDEISNAYDNAILYTDYFLSHVIQLLKGNDKKFETAMFYVSDHGESLGENGIYLHGLPYSISPIEQRKVPLIMWFGGVIEDDIDLKALKAKRGEKFTHDNVFHTMLRLMEVQTTIYDKKKDIIDYNEEYPVSSGH